MAKRQTVAQRLALKAAAAARDVQDDAEGTAVAAPEPTIAPQAPVPADPGPPVEPAVSIPAPDTAPQNKGGRPAGRRQVANKQTVYLDERRHRALVRAAEDRGRSIHSLILEGIDVITGKPTISTWD